MKKLNHFSFGKALAVKTQLREFLMSSENTISIEEARKEVEKEWPKSRLSENSEGMIDSRILWIPIALIILYLIYKAFIQ